MAQAIKPQKANQQRMAKQPSPAKIPPPVLEFPL